MAGQPFPKQETILPLSIATLILQDCTALCGLTVVSVCVCVCVCVRALMAALSYVGHLVFNFPLHKGSAIRLVDDYVTFYLLL